MKLVVDLRMINMSGIGTYLKNIIPGILPLFDEVAALGNPEELSNFQWVSDIHVIPFTKKIYSIQEQLLYSKVIPVCDVYWSPHINAPLLPTKAKKIVVTIHDAFHLSSINKMSFAGKLYAKLLFNNAAKKSEFIFTVSEFSKSEILKYSGVKPGKVHVVYCGVNVSLFNERATDVAVNNLPENYLLYVGNVKPHKNLLTLLKAYNNLSNSLKTKYNIVIIGRKEGFITSDNELDTYISNNSLQDKIIFTGYVQDNAVPAIYKKATLFIFPSLYEGFGLPVLESLAVGTPVISSDAASLPEVGGCAVTYFNPYDCNELSSKIIFALTNPDASVQLLKNASAQTDMFTWQKSVDRHLVAFKSSI